MSATISHPPLRAVPFRSPTARLALKPESPAGAELDGAWWPRSRDLPSELATLAGVLDPLWGRVTRMAANPRHWPILPPMIVVNGHMVKVSWLTAALDPHAILVLSFTAGPWNLLVIPPETGTASAARLMTTASADSGPPMSASALMAAAHIARPKTRRDESAGACSPPAPNQQHAGVM